MIVFVPQHHHIPQKAPRSGRLRGLGAMSRARPADDTAKAKSGANMRFVLTSPVEDSHKPIFTQELLGGCKGDNSEVSLTP